MGKPRKRVGGIAVEHVRRDSNRWMTAELHREQVDGSEVELSIRKEGEIRAQEQQQCTEEAGGKK